MTMKEQDQKSAPPSDRGQKAGFDRRTGAATGSGAGAGDPDEDREDYDSDLDGSPTGPETPAPPD